MTGNFFSTSVTQATVCKCPESSLYIMNYLKVSTYNFKMPYEFYMSMQIFSSSYFLTISLGVVHSS